MWNVSSFCPGIVPLILIFLTCGTFHFYSYYYFYFCSSSSSYLDSYSCS